MGKRETTRAGEPGARHRAVVHEGVVDDEVLGAVEVSHHRDVGGVSAHESQGLVSARKPRDTRSSWRCSSRSPEGKTACRHRSSITIDRVLRGLRHSLMARQAQVVVGREIDEGPIGRHDGVPARAIEGAEEGVLDAGLGQGPGIGRRAGEVRGEGWRMSSPHAGGVDPP